MALVRSSPGLVWQRCGMTVDGDLLRHALEITTGDRAHAYGHASKNLEKTARLMDAYLSGVDRPLTIGDVAALMACVKLARLHHSPDHYDSLLDIAGYMSAAWDGIRGEHDESTA